MVGETFDDDFARDLEGKLDNLIAWAAGNAPTRRGALAVEDFAGVREAFLGVAMNLEAPLDTAQEQEPEPEEGGEQYININPAPWP